MREDPIISGWLIKALLGLMVVAGIGYGGYRIVDGLDIDLDSVGEEVASLDNTELEGTTINGGDSGDAEDLGDPRTAPGLAAAIARIREEAGAARLTRMTVNEFGTQFYVLRGGEAKAYSVPRRGDVSELPATISITGNADVTDFAYGLGAIKPAAIARMVREAARLARAKSLDVQTLALERALPFGRRALEWTLNARKGSRALTFRASADGRRVENVGGDGIELPQAALDAEKLNRCISDAGSDTDRVLECLEKF